MANMDQLRAQCDLQERIRSAESWCREMVPDAKQNLCAPKVHQVHWQWTKPVGHAISNEGWEVNDWWIVNPCQRRARAIKQNAGRCLLGMTGGFSIGSAPLWHTWW
jgi:hypothetical protein